MNIQSWIQQSSLLLQSNNITTSRLDCLVLLEDEIGKDKGWILAHPEYELKKHAQLSLTAAIEKRTLHIPLAYIRGHTEFYGRDFLVNQHVLEPRPESEGIIDMLKMIAGSMSNPVVADIGTGSGSLAITAKLELPNSIVLGIDIDATCLNVAQNNAKAHHVPITLLLGNFLEPLLHTPLLAEPLILLCNLPYVPDDFEINFAATHEPAVALFGGPDGLDTYRTLFKQLVESTLRPKYILTESLPHQHKVLAEIAKASGYTLSKSDDFIQLFSD